MVVTILDEMTAAFINVGMTVDLFISHVKKYGHIYQGDHLKVFVSLSLESADKGS